MSVTVTVVSGPDDANYVYLKAVHDDNPACNSTASITRSAIASGAVNVATQRDALVSRVEQMQSDYLASQAALANL